ncbi:ribosome biogenesis protein WDR12 homolog [Lolium rigidum]|uniref:ribosome biogenesis protein WDR12 homolog n=1 Tax=Lolium rigidum TaxID=89674 RepID=UPI001F5CB7F6|nr:ribosome biogenesis protein WDR12 homolog [Lolium rigidum]
MDADESRQVRVRFVTKLPPPLRALTTAIAVPAELSRMGLSEIVNSLILSAEPDHQAQPFDFIVDGELVRMPLHQFLLAKGISAERVLELEYVKAVAPKKQEQPLPHDDWVSAVDGSNSRFLLTGCYDGLARIWKDGAVCTHVLEGHSGAVTSASFINKGLDTDGSLHVVTGSKDRSLRLFKFDTSVTMDSPKKIGAYKILPGHSSSVQSIAVDPSRNMICSGSWDTKIKLWAVEGSEEDGDAVTVKKRRTNSDASEPEESQLEGSASSTFEGHSQCVSSVAWPEQQTIYSASWDHSVRQWDAQTGKETWNMFCGKALNCLDCGGEGSSLIAAGGSDPVLRVWDPRKPGTIAPVFQFSSHSSWISACKWHPSSWYHLLSSSFDGKVMLWDLRTAWPLASVDSHTEKVLCADWWKGDSVISGGADSKLCISSGVEIA